MCCFSDSAEIGGAELAMMRLLTSLDAEEWRPVALLLDDAPGLVTLKADLNAAGVEVVPVAAMPDGLGSARLVPRFMTTLRATRPSVFHAHLTWPFACKFGLLGAIAARVPAVIATVHAFPDVQMPRSARVQRSLMARGVDRYLVASRYAAHRLASALPASREKIRVVPNGVELGAFDLPPDEALRHEMSDGGTKRVVLVPARLDGLKGHDVLFRSCADLPEVRIVVAGDGPERPRLEALALGLGMADRVAFLGFRRDVPALLAASDLVVLPTLNEAFGLVLVEAMAAARPVVSTTVGGPEEIVEDGETGLLVPPSDAPSLRAAIARVLDQPGLARRFGDAGRARVRAFFSNAVVAPRVAEVYREILDGTASDLSEAT